MILPIDKQNGKVAYNDEAHKYWSVDDNSKYISVTTLIGKFENPYDKEFWSKYKALERLMSPEDWKPVKDELLGTHKFKNAYLDAYGIDEKEFLSTQQDILDEWAENNRVSCERGTKIHANLEHSFYNKKHDISLAKYEIGGKFECVPGQTDLTLENGVYPEYLISWESKDGVVKLAGQIDLLVIKGNHVIIGDWKTNKRLDLKSFYDKRIRSTVKMKYPLNDLDDCNFKHYNMQLSTYAWMIKQKNPDYVIDDLVLVWFDHQDNMSVYHIPFLEKEVERMLKYYKKTLIQQQMKDRATPIIY